MLSNRILSLVSAALNGKPVDSVLFSAVSDGDWHKLMRFANQQSVLGLCLDAFDKFMTHDFPTQRNLRMQWIGNVMVLENVYNKQKTTIKKLSTLFSDYGLKLVLMKGYGLSKLYPVAAHRGCGDLDIYFCGKGQYADDIIKGMDIVVKQNEEKHSVYDYNGSHVENHASIICDHEHPSLFNVENFLKKELNENICLDVETGCWLPSAMFNAVFLPLHFAGHFVYGGANLRQLIDYALVVRNAKEYSTSTIDWEIVKSLAVEAGYFKFLCCLNRICIEYIGISAECFPNWPTDKVIEKRILNEVLNPTIIDAHSLIGKIERYLSNRWKYQLVYSKESHLIGFILRTRSWINWKWGKKSVWKN